MPEAQIIPNNDSMGSYRYVRNSFFTAGQDSYRKPPAQDPDMFERFENVMPPLDGVLKKRWGYSLFNNTALASRRMYVYQNDSPIARKIVVTSTTNIIALNEDGTTFNSGIFTPDGSAGEPRMVASRGTGYFVDGITADLKKWDGSSSGGVTNWGLAAPAAAITVGSPVAGDITLVSGRKYFYIHRNSTTVHNSGLNPVSVSTGAITAKNIPLSVIAASADAQSDRSIVLATADGGDQTKLFFLADIPDSQTTLTDNVPEATLLANNVYLETDDFSVEHGVTDNAPAPNGTLPTKHKGRIYMVLSQFLRFSKSQADLTTSTGVIAGRYEECWPAAFELDVSEGAEEIKALLSDGESLWIATERHIRRLQGDGPSNFQKTDIVFNETGVLTQESWQVVAREGTPVGAIWITPDYRVLQSDFNIYKDIGTPIQDVLDSINDANNSKVNAAFYSDGPYDLYMLAVPTGSNTEPDTLCIYDLRRQKWLIWVPTDKVTAQLYNIDIGGLPQWLWTSDTNKVQRWRETDTQDRVGDTPVDFSTVLQTSWLDLGDSLTRKFLNELEYISSFLPTVTIESASNSAEFASPATVILGEASVLGPFGDRKFYLADNATKDRYYRLRFTAATASSADVLQGFNLEVIPIHRF